MRVSREALRTLKKIIDQHANDWVVVGHLIEIEKAVNSIPPESKEVRMTARNDNDDWNP